MSETKNPFEDILLGDNLPEEELTKRQWQIIEAATKVFAEKGFEASRTSDIAREAEVAEGTIFRYFKTKKDLLLGLLIPLVTKFFRPLVLRSVEKIMDNRDKKPVENLLKEIYLDRLSLVRKNLPLVKTVMVESLYHPELLKPIREDLAPNLIPIVDGFVSSYIEKGEFRDLDPRLVTRSFMSMLLGYVVLTGGFPETFQKGTDEEEVERLVDIFLRGVINREAGKE